MKCITLCAGYATRLYPITLDQPKPLLPIAGRPIIEHIIAKVEKVDSVDEIFVVTNDKFYDSFRKWKLSFSSQKPIKIVNDRTKTEEKRLGAIGDMHFVMQSEKISDDIMVIAGDNLFDFSLAALEQLFLEKKTSSIALYDILDGSLAAKKYGVVETGKDGSIKALEEKPESPKTTLVSTACYIFSRKDMALMEKCIKENSKPDNLGDFIKYLIKNSTVFGHVFRETWFDIGSREQLKQADIVWSSRK